MRLTVLGGSAATPNGGDASSGYLVTSGGTTVLVDCGSGVVAQLRARMAPQELRAVIVSHLHSDHTLDLVALRYGLKYAPYAGERQLIPLYLPPGGLAFLARLGEVFQAGNEVGQDFWGDVFTLREYGSELERDEALVVGDLSIRFAPMPHFVPAWAMRFEDGAGRVLTYSADTGPQGPLAEFAAGSDLLLCEATLLQQAPGQNPAEYGHLTAAEAGQIATAAGVGALVLTHLWEDLGFDRYLADARAHFAGAVEQARAGAVFPVGRAT